MVNYFIGAPLWKSGVEAPTIHPEAMEFLQGQLWLTNVREMENVIRHALLLAGDQLIT